VRRDLFFSEAAERLAELLVFGGEREPTHRT
jgi:hypothetical protein